MENTFIQFTGVSILESSMCWEAAIYRDLNRLKRWTVRDLMEFQERRL